MEATFPRVLTVWLPSWRIVPARLPTVDLFERVAGAKDLEAVRAIEALTDPQARQAAGDLSLVPPEERISGPGTAAIMAAFTHPIPVGSRFTDGSFGVYYCARSLQTAVAETRYQAEAFMRMTGEAPMELERCVYLADLRADLQDLRGRQAEHPDIYHTSDYTAGQRLGAELRAAGSHGLLYDSLRDVAGTNAAVFRPPLLSNCRRERQLGYHWDGTRIAQIVQKRPWSGA